MIRYKTRSGKPETFTYKNIRQQKKSVVIDGEGTIFEKAVSGLDKFCQKYAGADFRLISEINPVVKKEEPKKEPEPVKEPVKEESTEKEEVKEEPVKMPIKKFKVKAPQKAKEDENKEDK